MFSNYLKIAWRNILKNKTFSAINIFGLSFGIAAFLMIINYLRFEYSYDDMHANKNRIYRVPMMVTEKDGKEQTFAFTYPALAPAMKKDFPEVDKAARFRRRGGIVANGDLKIIENGGIFFADKDMFDIFSFSFKQGKAADVFNELNDAVITEETAMKYFGHDDPMGKTLRYNDENYVIKGVLENVPVNSHIRFNILLNYEKYIQLTHGDANTSWGWSDFYTYVLLKPGANPKTVEAKFPDLTLRYMGEDMKLANYKQSFVLQPLKDIHTKSTYDYEFAGNGDMSYLKYLGIAALFILFIAWINYINLSTARSLDRAREVGVRKVAGAGRFQLVRQFLAESFLINLIAVALGVIIFYVSLPWFSHLVEKSISSLRGASVTFWIGSVFVFVVGTFLAGFYPAFVLSSFDPIQAIKGLGNTVGTNGGKAILRKSLVVIQFVAAIVLIAGALGFYRQLHFMQDRDLGVNIQQTLVVNQTARIDSAQLVTYHAFLNDVRAHSSITSITASTSVPGSEVGGSSGFSMKNASDSKRCRILGIDKDFIPAYGLDIVAGINFTTERPNLDTNAITNILVNETTAKIFGFDDPAKMLGKEMRGSGFNCKVIGIVKDFHQESLANGFDPIVFYLGDETNFDLFSFKFNTKDVGALLEYVKQKWNVHYPQSPFSYFFLDERFNAQYNNDRLFSSVLWLFTIIAISIASLGLLGLSIYTIAKRKKEISIRKALGATLLQVTSMMTKDYLNLVWLAAFIALPVAFLLVNSWLHKYAFHIALDGWFFVLPIMIIVAIALATVLFQSLKAAMASPVKNLRSE
jgi:putative ABC transport system permease protein